MFDLMIAGCEATGFSNRNVIRMKLDGFRLLAAPFTPMHRDGSLNLSVVAQQARYLVEAGVHGAFIGGTTGEGQSLTNDERTSLAEQWAIDPCRSQLELIVHVGHNCQRDAMRLASHALAIDANAIALHAATWFKYQDVDDLIEFCAPVATAAPSLPFYIYDIPKITGVTVSAAAFLHRGRQRIPTLAGVKFTNVDAMAVQECIQMNDGEFDVLWGCDETLLAGVALGASGAVGSTYNFAAPLYRKVLRAVEADDWKTARAEQARSVAMVRVIERFSPLAALKFIMKLVGVDCGPVRPPLANLTTAEQSQLWSGLDEVEFFSRATAGERTTNGAPHRPAALRKV